MQRRENFRELSGSFSFNVTEQGVTGQRVFLYSNAVGETSDGVDIPEIGDGFYPDDGSNIKLVCRSISKKYLFYDTVTNKKKYTLTCNYSSEPFDQNVFYKVTRSLSQQPKIIERPISIEFGGDYNVLQPNMTNGVPIQNDWKYPDGTTVKEPIPYRVVTAELNLTIYKKDSEYGGYLNNILAALGRVNGNLTVPNAPGGTISQLPTISKSGELFKDYPGNWLFSEFNSESFYNYEDIKMWRCELKFSFRAPSNSTLSGVFQNASTYGWLRILSNDGAWDIPYYNKGGNKNFIYPQTFDTGFSTII